MTTPDLERITTVEDDFARKAMLDKVQSAATVSISAELFEKLYLTPKVPHHNDNIRRFANPTPLGLLCGMFLFTGPLLLVLSTIFECIIGNFFSMMVCGLFTVFFLSFAVLQLPGLELAAPYAASGGAASKEFNAVLALYLVSWGLAFMTFWVFSLKTNVVFATMFLVGIAASFVLSAAYWKASIKDFEAAGHLQTAGGALLFVIGLLGWYVMIVIMAVELRMTVKLPLGDLSHLWPKSDVEIASLEKDA